MLFLTYTPSQPCPFSLLVVDSLNCILPKVGINLLPHYAVLFDWLCVVLYVFIVQLSVCFWLTLWSRVSQDKYMFFDWIYGVFCPHHDQYMFWLSLCGLLPSSWSLYVFGWVFVEYFASSRSVYIFGKNILSYFGLMFILFLVFMSHESLASSTAS